MITRASQLTFYLCCAFLLSVGCSKFRQSEPTAPPPAVEKPQGKTSMMDASFYGSELAGKKTANGEIYKPEGLTCAHRTLPFGTTLRVSNPDNGKTVQVRVNDRGPFVKGRELDLSHGAALALGMKSEGVSKVSVEILPDSPG